MCKRDPGGHAEDMLDVTTKENYPNAFKMMDTSTKA